MSNLVFPIGPTGALPGVKMTLKRRPVFATQVQTTGSGKELRGTFQSFPRYRYTAQFEFVRSQTGLASYTELATWLSNIGGALGSWDSFLLADPEDSVAASEATFIGTGAYPGASFQLQRNFGGGVLTDALGSWAWPQIPTWNLISYSDDVTQWNKNTGVTAVANAAIAPDGTATASRVQYDGSGAAATYRFATSQAGNGYRGVYYLASIWLRADAPLQLRFSNNLSTVTINVTTTWQRFTTTVDEGNGRTVMQCAIYDNNNAPWTVYAWGGQLENVPSTQTTPGPRIATGATRPTYGRPALWPTPGDGFEPVFDLAAAPSLTRVNDWQGPVPLSPVARTNHLIYSQDYTNAAWTKQNGATATSGAFAAPDGTNTAIYVQNATGVTSAGIFQTATLIPGRAYTFSIWVHGDGTTNTCDIALYDPTGAVYLTPTSAVKVWGYGTVTITSNVARVTGLDATAWTRISVTAVVGVNASIRAYLYANTIPGTTVSGVYAWGAQLEGGTVTGDYIRTTAYARTVQDFVWAPPGGATRTNLCLQSQTFNTTPWGATNASVTVNTAAAPDGTTTADTLTDNATNGQHFVSQSIAGLTIGQQYTASIYAKAGTAGFLLLQFGPSYYVGVNLSTGAIDVTGGAGQSAVTFAGNGWYRIQMSFTATATAHTLIAQMYTTAATTSYAGTGSTVFVWGAQLEAGGVPTDYIATTTAAASLTVPGGYVSLANIPAANTWLTWSGTYYRRVRLATDEHELTRFGIGYWENQGIEFLSVK